jgi:hypothetical protein
MPTPSSSHAVSRRRVLQATAAGLAGLGPISQSIAETVAAREGTVRDRLWIFACAANSDYINVGRRSVMTPVESTLYFGVPNLFVVQSSEAEGRHGRLNRPFAQYALAMRTLKRVVWSVVGSGGFTSPEETKEVFEMAGTLPNFAGIFLDDYFSWRRAKDKPAPLTVDQLAAIRGQLKQISPKLDVFTTLYITELDLPIQDDLKLIDVVTLWTWEPKNLANLETNLKKLEQMAPKARKMLGCYLVDYNHKCGTPLEAMRLQCETGLRWLEQGRIEGLIFLGNTVMDLGFESVEWTRKWIAKVADRPLAARGAG